MEEQENIEKAKKQAIYMSVLWVVPLVVFIASYYIEINSIIAFASIIIFFSGIGVYIHASYIWKYIKLKQNLITRQYEN